LLGVVSCCDGAGEPRRIEGITWELDGNELRLTASVKHRNIDVLEHSFKRTPGSALDEMCLTNYLPPRFNGCSLIGTFGEVFTSRDPILTPEEMCRCFDSMIHATCEQTDVYGHRHFSMRSMPVIRLADGTIEVLAIDQTSLIRNEVDTTAYARVCTPSLAVDWEFAMRNVTNMQAISIILASLAHGKWVEEIPENEAGYERLLNSTEILAIPDFAPLVKACLHDDDSQFARHWKQIPQASKMRLLDNLHALRAAKCPLFARPKTGFYRD
jgi:hypothetical protein